MKTVSGLIEIIGSLIFIVGVFTLNYDFASLGVLLAIYSKLK